MGASTPRNALDVVSSTPHQYHLSPLNRSRTWFPNSGCSILAAGADPCNAFRIQFSRWYDCGLATEGFSREHCRNGLLIPAPHAQWVPAERRLLLSLTVCCACCCCCELYTSSCHQARCHRALCSVGSEGQGFRVHVSEAPQSGFTECLLAAAGSCC